MNIRLNFKSNCLIVNIPKLSNWYFSPFQSCTWGICCIAICQILFREQQSVLRFVARVFITLLKLENPVFLSKHCTHFLAKKSHIECSCCHPWLTDQILIWSRKLSAVRVTNCFQFSSSTILIGLRT